MRRRQIYKSNTIQVRINRDYGKLLKIVAAQDGTSIRELIDGMAIDILDQRDLLKRKIKI